MLFAIWSFFFVWISLTIRFGRSFPFRKVCLFCVPLVCFHSVGKGQSFEPYETSHVALIGWTQRNGAINFDCAGSYLGKNIILTGARCLERDGALADIVRLGTAMGSPMDFHVHNVTVHYRYQAEYYYHNMAIIILKEDPQTVSTKFKPACIYSRPPPIPEGRVHLMGRDVDDAYLKTELDLVDSDKCHEYYSPTKKLKYGALLVCCMCARNAQVGKCAVSIIQMRGEFVLEMTFDLLVRAGFADADSTGEEWETSSILGRAEDDWPVVWHQGARNLHQIELGWTFAVDCDHCPNGFLQSRWWVFLSVMNWFKLLKL